MEISVTLSNAYKTNTKIEGEKLRHAIVHGATHCFFSNFLTMGSNVDRGSLL